MCVDSRQSAQRGFTLIELMVTFLIISVLAAIAYPQYQEHVRKARRAEVATALIEGAQRLERYYSAHASYKDGDNLAAVFPTQVPQSGDADSVYYEIAPTGDVEDGKYSLMATAKGVMQDDKCGNFVITQSGKHELDSAGTGVTVADCWRR